MHISSSFTWLLLSDRQSGRWVYYRLQPEVIQTLQGWLETLIARSQSKEINCLD